jgi:plastocyanin
MKRSVFLLAVVAIVGFVTVGSVFAEEGAKAPGTRPIMGEITKIDAKVLTLTVSSRDGATSEQKVTVEDSTEVFNQAAVKLADVKVGDRVRIVQGDKRVFGEVTKIDGKTLTVKNMRNNEEQTVTVDENTQIMGSVKAKFEDLKTGQRITVAMKEGKAARIEIVPARPAR